MKKINFKEINKKYILIGILLLIIVGLLIFSLVFAFNHFNDEDKITLNDVKGMYNLDSDQLDFLKQPDPKLDIKYDELPETDGTLTDVDLKTLKKIFQTAAKSILVIEKEDCSFCKDFEPKLIEALNYFDIKAYKIMLNDLSKEDKTKLYNYIDYEGTPTTFIIYRGKATHSLTGTTDLETIKAYIDYYYLREE